MFIIDDEKKKQVKFATETEYQFGNRKFIVSSRFKDEGETIEQILLKLMISDIDAQIRQQSRTTQK